MMKRIKIILMMLCLCGGFFAGLDASAETKYVYDQADLLTDEEEQEFQSYAESMKESYKLQSELDSVNSLIESMKKKNKEIV